MHPFGKYSLVVYVERVLHGTVKIWLFAAWRNESSQLGAAKGKPYCERKKRNEMQVRSGGTGNGLEGLRGVRIVGSGLIEKGDSEMV